MVIGTGMRGRSTEHDFSKPRSLRRHEASAVVYDTDGAVGPVCDSLADASERADAMQATRAEDHLVNQRRAVAQSARRVSRMPLCDVFGPGALPFDRLPAGCRGNLYR